MIAVQSVPLTDACVFTTSTDVAEIKSVVLRIAETICSVSGLVIIPSLTRDEDKGAAYYLGKSEDDAYPLLVVYNPFQQTSYYYRYAYVDTVKQDRTPYGGFNNTTSGNNSPYAVINLTGNVSHTLVYIKTAADFVFSIHASNVSDLSTDAGILSFMVAEVENNDISTTIAAKVYSSSFIASYNQNILSITYAFMTRSSMFYCMPSTHDALLPIYIGGGYKLKNILAYTNRHQDRTGTGLIIDGKQYMILTNGSNSNYCAFILQVD